jgi:hypothetical protein
MTDAAPDTEAVQRLLALDLGQNDADAPTLREYLTALLHVAWTCGDNLKRAFGTSGWRSSDVYGPMVRAGLLAGQWKDGDPDDPGDEGYLLRVEDEREAEALVAAAIDVLSGVPSKAPSTVTVGLPDGLTRTYQATSAFKDESGHLTVVAPDPAAVGRGRQVAVFAHGQWASYEESGCRAPSGPVQSASVDDACRVLAEIDAIVSDETITDELAREDGDGTTEELRSIRKLLSDWRNGVTCD